MSAPQLSDIAQGYRARFSSLVVRDTAKAELTHFVSRIGEYRSHYQAVAARFSNDLPWFGIALLHAMEADLDFTAHLHNGDPLTARTVHAPTGRPFSGRPPFAWADSAFDALCYDGWQRWRDWSLAGLLYRLEAFNGWGYRDSRVAIPSPYLWAGCQHYLAGKFVADGKYDPHYISRQVGAGVILRALCDAGVAVFKAEALA